ncbi:MAG: bZIP transcription factor [Lachnospiraceae bacterium]|nr:bZIP transcription factor [Lachnospiraceae bacterium]
MKREYLLERLSCMQDFKIVPDEFHELMKNRKKSPKTYRAESDPRFSSYLEYASPKEKGHDAFLMFTAFSIAANLSVHNMQQPSISQLSEMLQITGYTPEEMEDYVRQGNGIEPEAVPSTRLQPAVFLVAHALEDALADKSEWRRGKRREENPALIRLKKLANYMLDKGLLLYLMDLSELKKANEYDAFVLRHTAFLIKQRCFSAEMDEAFQLVQNRLKKIDDERDREVMRLMRNKPSTKMTAPLAKPVEDVSFDEFMELFQAINSGDMVPTADVERLIARRKAAMPAEARAVIDRAEKEYSAITGSFDKILEKADDIKDEIWADKDEWMQCEYMPAVAEDAFRAIVNGDDEIFKLKIGRYIWQDFMSQSALPIPVVHFEELEDEDEWDFVGTEGNGKLGLKIYDEDDLMEVKTDSVNGMETITLPLSSVLSKYGGKVIEPHLYIRKSHIKVFKDAGFSDRRARDFAIVLGLLSSMNRQEAGGYTFEYENLYDLGESDGEQIPTVETITAEVQPEETNPADDKAREDLERKLKQAQKENQSCRHEISVLQREVERLRHQLTERKAPEEEEAEEAEPEEEIEYPYRTKLKVVVYGGFEVFHRELQKLLPDVRIVGASAHIDVNPIRNADIVFLQINKTDHSGYWTVCDACRNAKVPYIHLNYASARRCADVMVGEIKKREK